MASKAQLTGQSRDHLVALSDKLFIHKAVAKPWQALQQAALAHGFDLQIASGFRDFERQLSIWNRKFTGQLPVKSISGEAVDIAHLSDAEIVHAIMLYSALPGTSRHHWGTDIDVYAPNLLPNGQSLQLEPWEYEENGYFSELAQWLDQNISDYGFFYPYKRYQNGVAAEPWHLSFAPIANDFNQQLNQSMVKELLLAQDIQGKNAIIAMLPELFDRYVKNITPSPF